MPPVFEGPDEPNHFLFIRYLQIYHQLPVQGTELNAVRAHHPPAYFALGALLLAWSPPGASADWSGLPFQENPRYVFRLDDRSQRASQSSCTPGPPTNSPLRACPR